MIETQIKLAARPRVLPSTAMNLTATEVRAFLSGKKTQFRRPMHPQHTEATEIVHAGGSLCEFVPVKDGRSGAYGIPCPYEPGRIFWGRETWATADRSKPWELVAYRADGAFGAHGRDSECERLFVQHGWLIGQFPEGATGETRSLAAFGDRWRPSTHMPRWASRIAVRVKSVRAERLNAITNEDAIREGFDAESLKGMTAEIRNLDGTITKTTFAWSSPSYAYGIFWNAAYESKGLGWSMNPWVFVVDCELIQPRRATT